MHLRKCPLPLPPASPIGGKNHFIGCPLGIGSLDPVGHLLQFFLRPRQENGVERQEQPRGCLFLERFAQKPLFPSVGFPINLSPRLPRNILAMTEKIIAPASSGSPLPVTNGGVEIFRQKAPVDSFGINIKRTAGSKILPRGKETEGKIRSNNDFFKRVLPSSKVERNAKNPALSRLQRKGVGRKFGEMNFNVESFAPAPV